MKQLLIVVAVLILTAGSAHAKTLMLEGRLDSSIAMRQQMEFSADKGLVQSFSFRFALPADFKSKSVSQSVDSLNISINPRPKSSTVEQDRFGNRFQKVVWENVDQDIRINLGYSANVLSELSAMESRTPFPIGAVSGGDALYLKSTEMVQSDSPEITELARRLTAGARNEYEAVSAITNHVTDAIKYTFNPPKYDALYTLETKSGNCQNFAHLNIALLRSVGIPARIVGGITLKDSWKVPIDNKSSIVQSMGQGGHAWMEIYFPDLGWLPYDPQQSRQFTSSRHIKQTHGLDSRDINDTWRGAPYLPRYSELIEGSFKSDDVRLVVKNTGKDPRPYIISNLVAATLFPAAADAALAAEQRELERIARETAARERQALERAERERIERERIEKERAEAERLDKERLKRERQEAEELVRRKADEERQAIERDERERLALERVEAERLAGMKLEEERRALEKAEKERLARERAEAARLAKVRADQERKAREDAEKERLALKKAEEKRLAKLKAEQEKKARDKAEKERLAREKSEADRQAKLKAIKPPAGSAMLFGNMEFPNLVNSYSVQGNVGTRILDKETSEYVTSQYIFAQAFKLKDAMALDKVSLAMRKFGGDGNVYIDLVRDAGGRPNILDGVRSNLVALEDITRRPGYYWVDFSFPHDAQSKLKPGKYWIVFRSSGEAIMNWFYIPGKPYGDGDDTRSTAKGFEWEDILNYDFVFKVAGKAL